jgi:putative ABC transport system substrate-binding protein
MIGPEPRSPVTKAFLRGLRDLGYVYGEHFVTEPRGAESRPERYPALVGELVGLQVDVIVAGRRSLPALKQATATIPLVMAPSDDPVGRGFVRSLGHPGGNFTGMSSQRIETIGKRLHLLKELVPSTALVGVI